MKSPALSEAMRPLERLAARANEAYAAAMEEYAIQQRLVDMTGKDAEAKASKSIKDGDIDGGNESYLLHCLHQKQNQSNADP